MSTALREIMQRIELLSAEERAELQREFQAPVRKPHETPEQSLSRKLREMGLVREARLPRDPNQPDNPVPVVVQGQPLSEFLIEERR